MPYAQKIFSGRCDGGPWDGRQLVTHMPRYAVYWTDPQPFPRLGDPPQQTVELHSGYYIFGEGAWQWDGPKCSELPSAE